MKVSDQVIDILMVALALGAVMFAMCARAEAGNLRCRWKVCEYHATDNGPKIHDCGPLTFGESRDLARVQNGKPARAVPYECKPEGADWRENPLLDERTTK